MNDRNSQLQTARRRLARVTHAARKRLEGWRPGRIPVAYKLAILITLLITTGMIMLGVLVARNQTQLLHAQIAEYGNTLSQQLAESSKELVLSDDLLGLMVLISNLGTNDNILGATVYSESGRVLASSGMLPPANILVLHNDRVSTGQELEPVEWIAWDENGDQQTAVSFIRPIRFQDLVAGYALVSFSKTSMSQALQDTIEAVAAATVLMIIVGIAVSFYMGRRLSQPIHDLMDARNALDTGDLDFRLQERREDEIGFLIDAFNGMADTLVEKHQVESVFSRFVSPSVARQVLANLEHVKLGGEHVEATALFADIVGFTSLSEKLPPNEVAELLNDYFTHISMASRYYRGTVDKYMGDCAMLIFGAPDHDPQHRLNAVCCAVMIQRMVDRLNTERQRQGKVAVHFRIGINSGLMLAGNMGSHDRMQYTVVGDAVNLAARLHTVAREGQIIASELLYTADDVSPYVVGRKHGSINLRGKTEPVTTYEVRDVAPDLRQTMEQYLAELLAGRSVA